MKQPPCWSDTTMMALCGQMVPLKPLQLNISERAQYLGIKNKGTKNKGTDLFFALFGLPCLRVDISTLCFFSKYMRNLSLPVNRFRCIAWRIRCNSSSGIVSVPYAWYADCRSSGVLPKALLGIMGDTLLISEIAIMN
jgi:hypothetical protein